MKNEIVETFLELVEIDSPSGEEELVCKYIAKRLLKLGITSEIDNAGNLFARVSGNGEPIIICAHMDTVEPGRNIVPFVQGDLIKSDGTTILGADNKVTIAAILSALEEVSPKERRALELVFSVREETDGGINEFDFSKLHSKFGIIADRASFLGGIVVASPWIMNLEITVKGVSAHSGMPEKGANALTIAANALTKLTWGRIDKDTTANIGIINGGSAMNTIPGEVELIGEVRSFNGKKVKEQLKKIKAVFEKEAVKLKGKVEVTDQLYCHGYQYDSGDKEVKWIKKVMKKTGLQSRFEISFGGSDANTFVQNGIKVVNIADGAENPHELSEKVTVNNLEKLAELFTEFIKLQ